MDVILMGTRSDWAGGVEKGSAKISATLKVNGNSLESGSVSELASDRP